MIKAARSIFYVSFSVHFLTAARPHSTIIPDSTQLTRQPTHSSRKSDTYSRAGSEADADTHSEDYTGGSDYTGGGTGDSGFGDAASLCRVPLRLRAHTQTQRSLEARSECYETLSSVRAGYYKSLNMETVQGECANNYANYSFYGGAIWPKNTGTNNCF